MTREGTPSPTTLRATPLLLPIANTTRHPFPVRDTLFCDSECFPSVASPFSVNPWWLSLSYHDLMVWNQFFPFRCLVNFLCFRLLVITSWIRVLQVVIYLSFSWNILLHLLFNMASSSTVNSDDNGINKGQFVRSHNLNSALVLNPFKLDGNNYLAWSQVVVCPLRLIECSILLMEQQQCPRKLVQHRRNGSQIIPW